MDASGVDARGDIDLSAVGESLTFNGDCLFGLMVGVSEGIRLC